MRTIETISQSKAIALKTECRRGRGSKRDGKSQLLSPSNIPKNKKTCLSWRDYMKPLKITAPIESDIAHGIVQ